MQKSIGVQGNMEKGLALIADASSLFREGLTRLLRQRRFTVCAEGRDVVSAAVGLDPSIDLALLICTVDAETSQSNTAQIQDLRDRYPPLKIIIMMDLTVDEATWHEAAKIADAILPRDISSKVIQRAIDLVMLGQKFFSARPAKEAPVMTSIRPLLKVESAIVNTTEPQVLYSSRLEVAPATFEKADVDLSLSDRERQILNCLIRGHSNKVIARELAIAEATVKVHVKGLLRKLRASNRTQAAVWALKHRADLNGVEVLAAD